jgi:hypothetical protein
MSEFFGHVADAALPVAVALLVLTAVARCVLWARIEGDEQRIASQHLDALAIWCLIATGTYAFAICAAGEAAPLPLGAAIALAVAAIVLRSNETAAVTADEPKPAAKQPHEPKPDVPTHGRTPAPAAHSLWDEPTENAKRTGLWAR